VSTSLIACYDEKRVIGGKKSVDRHTGREVVDCGCLGSLIGLRVGNEWETSGSVSHDLESRPGSNYLQGNQETVSGPNYSSFHADIKGDREQSWSGGPSTDFTLGEKGGIE